MAEADETKRLNDAPETTEKVTVGRQFRPRKALVKSNGKIDWEHALPVMTTLVSLPVVMVGLGLIWVKTGGWGEMGIFARCYFVFLGVLASGGGVVLFELIKAYRAGYLF